MVVFYVFFSTASPRCSVADHCWASVALATVEQAYRLGRRSTASPPRTQDRPAGMALVPWRMVRPSGTRGTRSRQNGKADVHDGLRARIIPSPCDQNP